MIKLLPLISKPRLCVVDFVFLQRSERERVKQLKLTGNSNVTRNS